MGQNGTAAAASEPVVPAHRSPGAGLAGPAASPGRGLPVPTGHPPGAGGGVGVDGEPRRCGGVHLSGAAAGPAPGDHPDRQPALRPAPHPPALPAAVRRQPSEAGGQRCPPAGQRPGHGGAGGAGGGFPPPRHGAGGGHLGGHSPGGASVPGGLCLVPPGPAPGRPAAAGRAGTSGRPAGLGAAESGLRRAAGRGGGGEPVHAQRPAGPSGRALQRRPGERHGRAGQLQRGRHEPHPAPAPGGGRAVGGAGGQAQCGAGGVGELL